MKDLARSRIYIYKEAGGGDPSPTGDSNNIVSSRFVVNFKPRNSLRGAGDKNIGTVLHASTTTVPIILSPGIVLCQSFRFDLNSFPFIR